MVFNLRDLAAPILIAPMAGGPSTPALAAAGSSAGGLGFVAGGYLSADAFAERLSAAAGLTSGPLGANMFVPHPSAAVPETIGRYAAALLPETRRYGAELGEPRFSDDDWSAKLEVLLDLRPALVSFTFGLPSVEERRRLTAAGIATAGTVTTLAEARRAAGVGVDFLVAQGPAAGGHRGTFDPTAVPSDQPLGDFVAVLTADLELPVVAAGGLATAADVARVRRAGAAAVQLGTAFLLAEEAGSSAVHRAALTNPAFTETVVTKAFSGRYARGVRNRFTDEHDVEAPFGYPEVHYLTGPVRAASVKAGDPHGTNIWAGVGFRQAQAAPAATIVEQFRAAAD